MPSSELRLQLAAELTSSDRVELERAMREASMRCRGEKSGSGYDWQLQDWRRYLASSLLIRLFPPLFKAEVEVHLLDRESIFRHFRDEQLRALDVCLETRFTPLGADLAAASPETLRKLACSVVGITWQQAQKSRALRDAVSRIENSLQRLADENVLAQSEREAVSADRAVKTEVAIKDVAPETPGAYEARKRRKILECSGLSLKDFVEAMHNAGIETEASWQIGTPPCPRLYREAYNDPDPKLRARWRKKMRDVRRNTKRSA
jgi:hypothetical protein